MIVETLGSSSWYLEHYEGQWKRFVEVHLYEHCKTEGSAELGVHPYEHCKIEGSGHGLWKHADTEGIQINLGAPLGGNNDTVYLQVYSG